MIQIRQSVFETNSSSTHSITIAPESDFNKWKNGEVYLNEGWWSSSEDPNKDKTFLTKDEAINLLGSYEYYKRNEDLNDMNDEELNEVFRDWDIYTFENYWDDYLEDYETHYTTEHGDDIIVFGQYGYNG
nr:MAG TPA: hypothetical protein [Caudoviricetes sp.]